MYIKRSCASTLQRYLKSYKVVLVTGARQVGKTTLLKEEFPNYEYVSLDSPQEFESAQSDPARFFESHPAPCIIDEAQYAPSIFKSLKNIIDQNSETGQYIISGSQSFNLMQGVTESLAGRIAILQIDPLSAREILQSANSKPFSPVNIPAKSPALKSANESNIFEIIHRGLLPALYSDSKLDPQDFYEFYLRTYLERDVKQITQVSNELTFLKFVRSLAARNSQLLNLSDIAKDVEVSVNTAKQWLSILQASHIVYLLQPYHPNIGKQIIKSPKIYFFDTGLAAHLTRWISAETIEAGSMKGAFFENFVVLEILKSYHNAGILNPNLFFYRDKSKNEIDLIIAEGDKLYPIEIKSTSTPSSSDAKTIYDLDPALHFSESAVISNTPIPGTVGKKIYSIPALQI